MAQSKTRTRKSKIQKSPIPVSVLVGFLGAGKTTLLNHLLSANHGRKIAIIVNEFGEINIDSKLVRHTTEKVIQMSNGCICCTLREDLLTELTALSQTPDLEYISTFGTSTTAKASVSMLTVKSSSNRSPRCWWTSSNLPTSS